MATRKVYKKAEAITSIDELVRNRHKTFMLIYPKQSFHLSYNKIRVMALESIVRLIESNNLYYAIIVEEEIIRKTKAKVVPKEKSDIGGCKVSLADIYRHDGESSKLDDAYVNDEYDDSNR